MYFDLTDNVLLKQIDILVTFYLFIIPGPQRFIIKGSAEFSDTT